MTKNEVIENEIAKLRKAPFPDEPYISNGNMTLTMNELAYHIETKSEIGLKCIHSLEKLHEDLIKRKKIGLWDN